MHSILRGIARDGLSSARSSTLTQPLFATADLSVRELTREDAPMMSRWLTDPRILEHWGGRDKPLDEDGVIDEFFNPDDDYVTKCLFTYKGETLGYLQFYPVEPEVKTPEYDYPPDANVWGIDLFIGEPEYWSMGIGTELLKATVAHIRTTHNAEHVVIDPKITNTRAIRSYEKAGFHIVKKLPKHEFHEGEHTDNWLMEHRP